VSDSEYMVTTEDNPYNYYTEYDDWYRWDTRAGYHTLNLLDRLTRTSDALPPQLELAAITDAIDEILEENVSGNRVKVMAPKRDVTPS
jgi:hypothetical protein